MLLPSLCTLHLHLCYCFIAVQTTAAGSPILNIRMSNRFCFLEFRSIEEATNSLSMTGIPFGSAPLTFNRRTKYEGPCLVSAPVRCQSLLTLLLTTTHNMCTQSNAQSSTVCEQVSLTNENTRAYVHCSGCWWSNTDVCVTVFV
jgi:hypothetical protein